MLIVAVLAAVLVWRYFKHHEESVGRGGARESEIRPTLKHFNRAKVARRQR